MSNYNLCCVRVRRAVASNINLLFSNPLFLNPFDSGETWKRWTEEACFSVVGERVPETLFEFADEHHGL